MREQSRERELVRAAQAGDESAVEVLYRDHYNTIYRYVLLRVGNREEAEDITSRVFLGMVRGLARFRWKDKPFVAWLYGIAQKQVAYHFRSASGREADVNPGAVEEAIADTVGPDASAAQREERLRLVGAMRMLPESQREVLLLRYVLGFPIADTAAAVGRSEGAVKQVQQRGLATLREVMSEETGGNPP